MSSVITSRWCSKTTSSKFSGLKIRKIANDWEPYTVYIGLSPTNPKSTIGNCLYYWIKCIQQIWIAWIKYPHSRMTGSCPHDVSLYTLLQVWSNFLSNITSDHDPVILTISPFKLQQMWITKDCCCREFHNWDILVIFMLTSDAPVTRIVLVSVIIYYLDLGHFYDNIISYDYNAILHNWLKTFPSIQKKLHNILPSICIEVLAPCLLETKLNLRF